MAGKPVGTMFAEIGLDSTKLEKSLKDTHTKLVEGTIKVEDAYKSLGIKSDQTFDMMRRNATAAVDFIKNKTLSSKEEIVRAEQAAADRIKQINQQQHGVQTSLLDSMKKNWVAASAVIVASWMAVNKAMEWATMGAKAQQAEESFRIVAKNIGADADLLLAGLMKASAGTIDHSDTMQRAVKGMTLGLNADKLIGIMETARVSARVAGTDVKEAYEDITNAIATGLPRALRRYGLITKEEMALVNKALKAGIEDVDLYSIAMLNAGIQAARMGEVQTNAAERIQKFNAIIQEAKESIGKFVIEIGQRFLGGLYGIAGAFTHMAAPLAYLIGGQDAYNAMLESGNDLMKTAGQLAGVVTEQERKANEEKAKAAPAAIAAAEAAKKAGIDKLKAGLDAATAAKKAKEELEKMEKKFAEDIIKNSETIGAIGKSKYEQDIALMNARVAEARKIGMSEIKIAAWVASETAIARTKGAEAWEASVKKMTGQELVGLEKQLNDIRKEADLIRKEFAGSPSYDPKVVDTFEQGKQDEVRRKAADDDAKFRREEANRIISEQEKGLKEYEKLVTESNDWSISDHQRAINKIMSDEATHVARMYELWEAGAINLAQLTEGLASVRAATALAQDAQWMKYLADAANFYSQVEGYEDTYRQKQIKWIEEEARRKATQWKDDVAAAKWAAQEKGKLEQDLFEKKTSQVHKGLGDMANAFAAIGSMYDKNSGEYARMQEAAKAMIVLQQAVAVANAVAAIANQGLGDPYTAFARIAAMASAMGSLLASAGIAFGGGKSTPTLPASTGLGLAAGESSESATKSWERLMEIDTLQYHELVGIHQSMEELNNNISGLISSIFRTGGLGAASAGADLSTRKGSMESLLSSGTGMVLSTVIGGAIGLAIAKFSGSIFGGKTSTSVVSGIATGGASLQDLIAGGGMGAMNYADITQKTSGGWFRKDKTSSWTQYAELDRQVSVSIDAVFKGIADTLNEAGKILLDDTTGILNYVLAGEKIALSGTAEEMEKQFSDYISRVGDTAAAALFEELVNAYQVAGEGALETVTRLAVDFATMNEVLKTTNQQISGTKFEMIGFVEAMVAMAGGLENLTDAAATYYDKFFSDAEKQARLQAQLGGAVGDLGYAMPGSREGYRSLVESLDLTTTAGQEAYVSLLLLSEAADTFYAYLEDAGEKSLADAMKRQKSAQDDIDKATTELKSAQDEYNRAYQAYLNEQVRLWDTQLKAQQDYVTGLTDRIEEVKKWLSGTERSTTAVVGSRNVWDTEYARLKGQATTDKGVSDFLSYSTDYLAFMQKYTGGNYKDIYEMVMGDVAAIGKLAEAQIPAAERQLAYTQAMDNAARAAADAQRALTEKTNEQLMKIAKQDIEAAEKAVAVAKQNLAAAILKENEQIAAVNNAAAVAQAYANAQLAAANETNRRLGAIANAVTAEDAPKFARGGLSSGPSLFGEAGPEWAVPTYEPQRSSFLKDVGADPDAIGRAVAKYVGGGDGKNINVSLFIDGKEVTNTVVRGIKSGDPDLIRNLRKAVA